jgi:hypothetical protein
MLNLGISAGDVIGEVGLLFKIFGPLLLLPLRLRLPRSYLAHY